MQRYIKAADKRIKNLARRFSEAYDLLFSRGQKYIQQAPSHQNALNLFKGEWISKLPPPYDELEAGHAELFSDGRIAWAIEKFGNIKGKRGLELGPLEGAHSYMLQQQGAAAITAVEANPRAYLRCLIVQQILGLNNVQFLCGDFIEYLRHCKEQYDFCVASGVLYHMQNPVEMIALASKCTSKLFLWTHYYDKEICKKNLFLKPRFSKEFDTQYEGFEHTLHRYEYRSAKKWREFCGGPAPFSHWLTRDDILECCRFFGFTEIEIAFENREHPHGPSFALVATRF